MKQKPTLYIEVKEEELEQKIQEKLVLQKDFIKKITSSINYHIRKYVPIYYTQGMLDQNIITTEQIQQDEEEFQKSHHEEMMSIIEDVNDQQNDLLQRYKKIKYYREEELKE